MQRWMIAATLLAGCGSSGVTVEVSLELPSKPQLSPYDPAARLAYLRVRVDGAERFDEVSQDLDLATQRVSFEGYPTERRVRVVASGFDELGNLVAYGEASAQVETDDVTLPIPFRRALAYVIHRDICDGGCGDGEVCANPGDGHRCLPQLDGAMCGGCSGAASACATVNNGPRCIREYGGGSRGVQRVYAIDVASKALVDVITLPDTAARPINITAKGGEGVWVTQVSASGTSAVFLSSSTHEWSAPLSVQTGAEHVMAAPGQKYVVASGAGFLGVYDGETGAKVREVPLGGRILDGVIGGIGDKAMIVTSETLALFDLEVPEEGAAVNPGDLPGSSGVALSADGRFAYVSSAVNGKVAAYDLVSGSSAIFAGTFVIPVRDLVFSERGQMVLGILTSDPSVFVGAYNVPDQTGFAVDRAVGTLPAPSGMASAAGGYRVIVVSAGTSTGSAGLTVVDPLPGEEPRGSTITYLRDPTETYTEGGNTFRQRYRPSKVAALYGQ